MERLRRILVTIQRQMGQLNPTARLLIAALAVILLLAFFVVAQQASTVQMVPLMPTASAAEQQEAAAYLSGVGIKTETKAGVLMVSRQDKDSAVTQLSYAQKLPQDSATFFKTLLESQNWANTRQQNEVLYNAALQEQLGKVISNFPGVKSATVIFDIPEAVGLGAAVRRPTASVAVFTKSGPLDQKTVDSVAALVGGAKAGLSADRVSVIDGTTGQQRKATTEDAAIPTTYLEHAQRVETQTREKLSQLLSYIPGVVIAVTAQVDVKREASKTTKYLPVDGGSIALPQKQMQSEMTQTEASRAAEPGVRSMQTASINAGSSTKGGSTSDTKKDVEFDNHVGVQLSDVFDPRGMPTMLAVSVNVPRSFVVARMAAAAPPPAEGAEPPPPPTEDAIAQYFDQNVKQQVAQSIIPHVRAMTAEANKVSDLTQIAKLLEGQIAVGLIPTDMAMLAQPAQAGLLGSLGLSGGGSGGGGAMGLLLGGGLVDRAVLGLLAVLALGMMVMMVRKSGRKVEMPTPEELVGLPPILETLQTKSELIGEADETDTPMTGIEVDESEIRTQKMLDSVSEMMNTTPDTASKLINRWIAADE